MEPDKILENPGKRHSLHPALWLAAIAFTLLCIVGIARLVGAFDPADEATEQQILSSESVPADAPPEQVIAEARKETVDMTDAAQVTSAVAAQDSVSRNRAVARTREEIDLPATAAGAPARSTTAAVCANCGVVESVNAVRLPAKGSGAGAVAGGVAGGLLGNQAGEGSGKDAATVAGAVIGGIAGHQVEKRVRATTDYQVVVIMDDGSRQTISHETAPQWKAGDRVRVQDGALQPAG